MGKRRFAGTLESSEHKTDSSKYGNDLTAWIRGWDYGVEVVARDDGTGTDVFEIWTAGGSNARSNGRRLIGKVIGHEFIRMN